jgi:peptidoglycan/xylan/chitin deacetylase (PgdA/CDA1 family)
MFRLWLREHLPAAGTTLAVLVALVVVVAFSHRLSLTGTASLPSMSNVPVVLSTPTVIPAVDEVSDAQLVLGAAATPAAPPADPAVDSSPILTTPTALGQPSSDISLDVKPFDTPSAVSADVPLPNDPTLPFARRTGPGPGAVPILMYHYIRVNPVASDHAGFVLSVSPADFEEQIRFLWSHGYNSVSMADVREHVRNGKELPRKPIAITFDDGYDDAYTAALPVLQRYHMTATFYIITGFLDRPRYMTWDQVITMDRAGMEIASHTVSHPGLPSLGYDAKAYQLTASELALETRLGHPVLDFCYPGGQLDVSTEQAVIRAGYLSATTTAFGYATPGDDPFRLPRVRVSGGEGLVQFAKLLGDRVGPQDLGRPTPTASPTLSRPDRPTFANSRSLSGCQTVGVRGHGPSPEQLPPESMCLPP